MTEKRELGFELGGEFYPCIVGDTGRDMLLVERLTGMTPAQFMDALEANPELASVSLALMATSIRAKHPDWSPEKIIRVVEGPLGEVEWFGGDEDEPSPPADQAGAEDSPERSRRLNGSADTTSEPPSEDPISSGSPGSDTSTASVPTT